MKKGFIYTLIIIITVIAALTLSACKGGGGEGGGDTPPAQTLLTSEDIKNIVVPPQTFPSRFSLNEQLNLEGAEMHVYLTEDSAYAALLSGENPPTEYQTATDESGLYLIVPITADNVFFFDSTTTKEDQHFSIGFMGKNAELSYDVFDENARFVNYDLAGGSFAPATVGGDSGLQILEPTYSYDVTKGLDGFVGATREYYQFLGWYIGENKITSIPAADISLNETYNLIAKWEPISYSLTFQTETGSYPPIVFDCEEESGSIPLDFTPVLAEGESADGLQFAGWYAESTFKTLVEAHSVLPCADTVYYGLWHKKAEVVLTGTYATRFRMGDKKAMDWSKASLEITTLDGTTKKAFSDSSVKKPTLDLSAVGEFVADIGLVFDSMNYTVKFPYTVVDSNVFFISYVLNEGVFEGEYADSFASDVGLQTLPTPNKTAFDFVGWYKESTFKTPITDIKEGFATDITLYAKYTEHVYTITYYIGAGDLEYALAEPYDYQDSYKRSETAFTEKNIDGSLCMVGRKLLETAEIEGYHFLNWHSSTEFTEDNIAFYIPENACEDLSFYAELGKKAESITVTSSSSFDLADGSLTLTANVLPAQTYYNEYTFEVVEDPDFSEAKITDNVLTASYFGKIIIRAYVDIDDALVYSEPFELTIIDNNITQISLEPNENGRYIVFAGSHESPIDLQYKVFPPTASTANLNLYCYASGFTSSPQSVSENDVSINGTTIAVNNPSVYGDFTVTIVLNPEFDENKHYILGTGIKNSQKFTVPKPIANANELATLEKDGVYALSGDIELSGSSWVPLCPANSIDSGLSYENAFNGYLNGRGHSINSLSIDLADAFSGVVACGLFGAINESGVVKNIVFNNVSISGGNAVTQYIGSVAGASFNGTVQDCSISGKIEVDGCTYVGGAVGYFYGEANGLKAGFTDSDSNIKQLTIIQTNSKDSYVGALFGSFGDGVANNCGINAVISAAVAKIGGNVYVGGMAGKAVGEIKACDNISVSLSITEELGGKNKMYVGGIAGSSERDMSSVTVNKFDFTANVSGGIYAGGVAGSVPVAGKSNGVVTNCGVEEGSITILNAGTMYVGGVVGQLVSGENLFYEGVLDISCAATSGAQYVGGTVADATQSVQGSFVSSHVKINSTCDITFGGICANSKGAVGGNSQITLLDLTVSGGTYGGISGISVGILASSEASIIAEVTSNKNDIYLGGISGKMTGEAENCISTAVFTVNASASKSVYSGAFALLTKGAVKSVVSDFEIKVISELVMHEDGKTILVNGGATVYAGGIAGQTTGAVRDSSVSLCEATTVVDARCVGKTTGSVYVGAVFGNNVTAATDCEGKGTLYVKAVVDCYLGGFAGKNVGSATRCTSLVDGVECGSAEVKTRYLGGFVGLNASNCIINGSSACTNVTDNVSGALKTAYLGGFAGQNDGTISASFVGFADENRNRITTNTVKLTETRSMNAIAYVGGFVGYNKKIVTNCYTDAEISSNTDTGGFVGKNDQAVTAVVSYCLALGKLNTTQQSTTMGGFVSTAPTITDKTFIQCIFCTANGLSNALAGSEEDFSEDYRIIGLDSSKIIREMAYAAFDNTVWIIKANTVPTLFEVQ